MNSAQGHCRDAFLLANNPGRIHYRLVKLPADAWDDEVHDLAVAVDDTDRQSHAKRRDCPRLVDQDATIHVHCGGDDAVP